MATVAYAGGAGAGAPERCKAGDEAETERRAYFLSLKFLFCEYRRGVRARHLACHCWPRVVVGSLEILGKRDAHALILGLFFIVEVLALRMQRLERGLRRRRSSGTVGRRTSWAFRGVGAFGIASLL